MYVHGIVHSWCAPLNVFFASAKPCCVLIALWQGKPVGQTHRVLSANAAFGATSVQVDGTVSWVPGDEIVITPTDYGIDLLLSAVCLPLLPRVPHLWHLHEESFCAIHDT
jgi:hypothetical protein